MKKYLVKVLWHVELEDGINNIAKDGWELVSITSHNSTICTGVFVKEVEKP